MGWRLLVAAMVSLPVAAFAQNRSLLSEQEKTAFIDELMDNKQRPDLQALHEEFPDVYAAIKNEMRARMERDLASGKVHPRDEAYRRGFAEGSPVYRQWLAEHVRYLGVTDDDAAVSVLLARGDITAHLFESDIQQCAIFATTSKMRGFRGDDRELTRRMMIWSAEVIRAIKSGIMQPSEENKPTEADMDALMEAAFSLDLDRTELENAFSGNLDIASPEARCRADIVVTLSIANMKGAARGRMARSVLVK